LSLKKIRKAAGIKSSAAILKNRNAKRGPIGPLDFYISLRNKALKSSIEAGFGFPGAHASAAAEVAKKSRSSSFKASSFVGMPTS
jgi:hypothetical protein